MRIKRIIIYLCTSLSLFILVGCEGNKEKEFTFDVSKIEAENVKGDVEIKRVEGKGEEGAVFSPIYISEGKVYGLLHYFKGENPSYPVMGYFKENIYCLQEDGTLVDTGKKPVEYSLIPKENISFESEMDSSEVYYVNMESGEKKRLGDGNLKPKNEESNLNTVGALIAGNKDYAYFQTVEINAEATDVDKMYKLNKLKLVNIKENKVYEYRGEKQNYFSPIVYSKLTNAFYGVDNGGRIFEISLENDEVKIKEFDSLKMNFNNTPFIVKPNENGEIVVIQESLKKSGETFLVRYNPKEKTQEVLKKEEGNKSTIIDYFEEENKLLLVKGEEFDLYKEIFIGEFGSKGDIRIICKVKTEKIEGKKNGFSSIISDDGRDMIVTEWISGEDGFEKKIYYFIKFK